jgi:hypothetical protein
MNNNKSSSRSSSSSSSSSSVTITSSRNENDDDDESSFDHKYVRLDKNKVHPLAYILRISRYGKFMAKLSNELVRNIKQIDKEVSDMQRMMEQKGMKHSSRTGMAWVRRMESKMVEIKSLKTSLNVLPKILKIEESNKKKYVLLTTWQRSLNLASLDDDDGDDDNDNDKEGSNVVEEEDEDHNSNTRKKKKVKRSSRQRLLLDRKKQRNSKLNNNINSNSSSSNSNSNNNNNNNNNTKKMNDDNDNNNDNDNDKTDYDRLLHRFMAPCVYASQHINKSPIVSLQNHRNRITEKYRQAKNQNKDMSTIVQDDLPSTSEKIQNFIGDYYCLCSGCQTMYNKQYKHLFGSYESHIGNEDMTATGKFFCVDCWNYYLNGKKNHVDGLKEKEKENNNTNNNSNISTSDNNSKNNDDDIIISSTTATTCTENGSTNGSTNGIDDISSQQQQPAKKARKKKKKKKKKANNDDDDDGDGDGNQREAPYIEENEHNINTNHFEIDDTSQQISEKTTSKNSSDDDETLIKQHVAFSNNDKWVDFLLQTGSIIALNDYMDEILGVED